MQHQRSEVSPTGPSLFRNKLAGSSKDVPMKIPQRSSNSYLNKKGGKFKGVIRDRPKVDILSFVDGAIEDGATDEAKQKASAEKAAATAPILPSRKSSMAQSISASSNTLDDNEQRQDMNSSASSAVSFAGHSEALNLSVSDSISGGSVAKPTSSIKKSAPKSGTSSSTRSRRLSLNSEDISTSASQHLTKAETGKPVRSHEDAPKSSQSLKSEEKKTNDDVKFKSPKSTKGRRKSLNLSPKDIQKEAHKLFSSFASPDIPYESQTSKSPQPQKPDEPSPAPEKSKTKDDAKLKSPKSARRKKKSLVMSPKDVKKEALKSLPDFTSPGSSEERHSVTSSPKLTTDNRSPASERTKMKGEAKRKSPKSSKGKKKSLAVLPNDVQKETLKSLSPLVAPVSAEEPTKNSKNAPKKTKKSKKSSKKKEKKEKKRKGEKRKKPKERRLPPSVPDSILKDLGGSSDISKNIDSIFTPTKTYNFDSGISKETMKLNLSDDPVLASLRKEIEETKRQIDNVGQTSKQEIEELEKEYKTSKDTMRFRFMKDIHAQEKKNEEIFEEYQEVVDETQREIDELRLANQRLRASVARLPKQMADVKFANKDLEKANEEVAGHIESIKKFVQKLETDQHRLQESSDKCKNDYLPRYRQELWERQQYVDAEGKIKRLYRDCIIKATKRVEKSRQAELVEDIATMVLETEGDVNPKFDPNFLFSEDSDSDYDSSSSEYSDSDSDSEYDSDSS